MDNEKLTIPVITSRKADEHFDKIKSEHNDMLQGMKYQAERVRDFKLNQNIETQQKDDRSRQIQKETHEAGVKNADINIKRLSLGI